MKFTTKINLITTSWIFLLLVLINGIVFVAFLQITFSIERDDLTQRATQVIEELRQSDDLSALNNMNPYLIGSSFIRIVDKTNRSVEKITNDDALQSKIGANYSAENVVQRKTTSISHREEQIIIVRQPFQFNGTSYTLEIGEKITGLEFGKDILLTILIVATVIGTLFSLIGGRWLSQIIMKPIRSLIQTMENIEQSGNSQKVPIENDSKDELSTMVKTFNSMIDRLDENAWKQTQFISDASHELKTPITIIMSYSDLLLRRGMEHPEVAKEALEAIHQEAYSMKTITETLLALAKSESNYGIAMAPVDVTKLTQSIATKLRHTYHRDILVQSDTDEELWVFGNEEMLKQMWMILIDNALKYSQSDIKLNLSVSNEDVQFSVVDCGMGIPEDELSQIFERFYRVDKARNRETGGTGLGLAIAHNLVQLHAGTIQVKSTVGIGTEVIVTIPKNIE